MENFINPFDLESLNKDIPVKSENYAISGVIETDILTTITAKPKRLRSFGEAVFTNLQIYLVIPIISSEPPSNQQFLHAKNIVTAVAKFLGCRVASVEMTSEFIRISCAIPPTLTVEKLAGKIQNQLLALWLATYRKPIIFAGGYCADSMEIEATELSDYLASQKAT